MQIREAKEADIPSIVELLKISLGESLMPKTEAFWRWKHIDNPFGKSPVLLAFDNEKLIGVRAFMRWEWVMGNEVLKAVRAVDTATHPDYQGKGIFSKLTLQLVEQCEKEGLHFIFNSPNKISKPGYLKMGWETLGRMKLFIKPILSLNGKNKMVDLLKLDERRIESLHTDESNRIITKPTHSFLKWRYESNPNVKYNIIQDESTQPGYLTIFRLKPYRFGTEFRICDEYCNESINRNEYRDRLNESIRESGANVVTSAKALPGFFSIGLDRGPEITIRKLSSLHNSLSFSNWLPTLGDMEVF